MRIIKGMAERSGALLSENIATVRQRIIESVRKGQQHNGEAPSPRLVCVSKTKPSSDIIAAYEVGERHFGENYVNEIVEKSHELKTSCPEIKWHFIGRLQSNKVNKVVGCPNLHMIETIDSERLADKVDWAWQSSQAYSNQPLNIMIQINTSQEEQKGGIPADEACIVVRHVQENCSNLKFCGLMTIGSFNHDYTKGPNPDFLSLLRCKQALFDSLGVASEQVEISMGMSNDFQQAIEMGSTSVRVGSTIFGARDYPQKQTK